MKRLHHPPMLLLLLTAVAVTGCGIIQDSTPPGFTTIRFSSVERSPGLDAFSTLAGPLTGGIYLYVQREANPSFATNMRISQNAGGTASGNLTLPNGDYRFYAFGYPSTSLGGTLHCGVANSGNPVSLGGGTKTVSLTMDSTSCASEPFATATHVFSGAPMNLYIHNCGLGEWGGATISTTCVGSTPTVANIQSARVRYPLYTANDSNLSELPGQPAPDANNSACLDISPGNVLAPIPPYGSTSVYGSTVSPPRIYTRVELFAGNTTCSGGAALTFDFPEGLENLASAKLYDAGKTLLGSGASVVKMAASSHVRLFLKN